MSSGFEHFPPRIPVTFRVNSYSPIKLTLLRPEWTKTADDLRLIIPECTQSQSLLLAYKWYMKQFNDVCRPEPPPIADNRDVLRYLFVAGYTLSLDALLSTVSDTEISRFGEHPDLTEAELVAEKDLLRKYVPDGTRVIARVSNTPQMGWIQDGRFMTKGSQMVHSSVFAFWAGMSAVANPHDVIWINKSPEICEPQTLTEYLKDAQKAQAQPKKSENEVVYPCAVADEYARLSAAISTPWATPDGIAALAKLTSTSAATSTATSTSTSTATAKASIQRPVIHPAKQTEQQDELKGLVCCSTRVQIQHNGLSMDAILEPNGTFSCGRDDDIHAAELLWRFNERIAQLDAEDVIVTDKPLEHITYSCSPSRSIAMSLRDRYSLKNCIASTPTPTPTSTSTSTPTTAATSAIETLVTQIQFTPQQLLAKATARTAELQAELNLWRQIVSQHKINKDLENQLEHIKASLSV